MELVLPYVIRRTEKGLYPFRFPDITFPINRETSLLYVGCSADPENNISQVLQILQKLS